MVAVVVVATKALDDGCRQVGEKMVVAESSRA